MSTEGDRGRVPGQGGRGAGFGAVLRERRQSAGLSQEKLARQVHYDKSHISKVESGDKPPTAAFARACDQALRTGGALLELAVRGQCPYPGLASFGAEDERWFHGRDRARAELLALLGERLADRGGPVAVVGPSGAGKSSLLRAGLVPALRRGALPALGAVDAEVFSPTAEPMARLNALARGACPVWIVDQAEELFTLCADPGERRAFLDRLCEEAGPDGNRLVVLGLRADLYGHALAHQGVLAAVRRGQLALGPMSAEELSRAITAPARTARLELEPGLLEVLLADLGLDGAAVGAPDGGAYDPGALPLLAHALRAVWQQRCGRALSLSGYRAIGGLHGSVALTAERAWSRLDGPARVAARRVLLRLVHLGPDGQVSRRRAELSQLAAADAEPGQVEQVLASFADDRLITLDAAGATLSHEALLRAWPRLRGWIEDSRDELRLHQQLTQDAENWAASGREEALLPRGSRLEVVRAWAASDGGRGLAPVERDFLAAAAHRADQERRAERRRVRTRRQLAGILALLLVAAALAGDLLRQEHERAEAATDGRSALVLLSEAQRSSSRDPYAALWQSVAARRIAEAGVPELRREADDAVLSTQGQYLAGRIPGFEYGVNGLALSPDGKLVATGDAQGRVTLWDSATTARVAELQGEVGHPVQDLEFGPDGSVLAAALTGDERRRILLWRVADRAPLPAPVMPVNGEGRPAKAKRLAFSRDGALLAAGSGDKALLGQVWVWRTDAGAAPPVRTLADHAGAIQGLAFGAGHQLASADVGGAVLVRDVDAPPRRDGGAPVVFAGRSPSPRSLAFAAGGGLLAVGDEQGGIRLWRPADPDTGPRQWPATDLPPGHVGSVNALDLTPDGATLVSAGDDGAARVWDVATGRVAAELHGHPTFVLGAAIGRDGRTVVTSAAFGSPPGSVLVWDLRRGTDLAPWPEHPQVTAVAAAGDRAAVGTADGRLALWDVGGPVPRPIDVTGPSGSAVTALAFDRGGRALASGTDSGAVQVRGAADGAVRASLRVTGRVSAVALSPDGSQLAVGTTSGRLLLGPPDGSPLQERRPANDDRVHALVFLGDGAELAFAGDSQFVRLLTVADPGRPVRASAYGHADQVRRLAVSPDGRYLATAGNDRLVNVWDTRAGARLDTVRRSLDDTVLALAFARDGRALAAVGREGRLRRWDTAHPDAPATTLTGPAQSLNGLAFLPDGRALVGGDDGTAPLWSLSPDAAVARACAVLRAPLPRDEWSRLLPAVGYRPDCG
ncbi:helix-turn-helix domain-containing protein [Kitasatospora sp. NPDC048407]|uniref:nSTAND1 domain-containing NTPase n=1 Tax=Kitasatospora sp. NPDC048407 TaxID=3364051 RepID=UPI00371AEB91